MRYDLLQRTKPLVNFLGSFYYCFRNFYYCEVFIMSEKSAGRPFIGETRKISITLPEKEWAHIDQLIEKDIGPNNLSAYFRIAHQHMRYDDPNNSGERGIQPIMGPYTMAVLQAIETHADDFETALQQALKMDAEQKAHMEAVKPFLSDEKAAAHE
jgi:hypothetical protein